VTTSVSPHAVALIRDRVAKLLESATSAAHAAGMHRPRRRDMESRLHDLEVDAETAAVKQRLGATRAQEHHHDLVNAFTAVDGALTILSDESLGEDHRAALTGMLGSGMARLRVLCLTGADTAQVALSELATSLAGERGWNGRVALAVKPDMVVTGSPDEIADSIRRMLVHACQRATSGPVTLRGGRVGDRNEIWVDDCGPPLSTRQRREILEPGLRRPAPGFTTVTRLDVAFRLARDQGATVMVESRSGGGASFGISWPVSHD
jgi:hypothetical protein